MERTSAGPDNLGSVRGGANHDANPVLAQISNELVLAQKTYFGRGPTQTKSYMVDDFLVVVMRGGITTAESTMIDFGRQELAREFRQGFENAIADRLVDRVQALMGRPVVNYRTQVLFDPHTIVSMFFFEPAAPTA